MILFPYIQLVAQKGDFVTSKMIFFDFFRKWLMFGRLQIKFTVHGRRPKASERRHARSAINTIQAKRSVVETQAERSVVLAMSTHCGHLGEMRQTETDIRVRGQSHISDMPAPSRPSVTTLRAIALVWC